MDELIGVNEFKEGPFQCIDYVAKLLFYRGHLILTTGNAFVICDNSPA